MAGRREEAVKTTFGDVISNIIILAGAAFFCFCLFCRFTGRELPLTVDLVDGPSMMPTVYDADRIIVGNLSFLIEGIERGDIVIADREEYTVIKRVIAMPGEKVKIVNEDGHAVIYVCRADRDFTPADRLTEDYILEPMDPVSEESEWILSADEYFICGDNRNVSLDSRKYGPIKKETLIGRVLYYLPV